MVETLSIVMPNYNYGHFIGEGVSSALAVDWPQVEVVVVDDGSTDNSLEVLAGFGDRITVLTQANSGPRVACNAGFAVSTGDVVIFLDSDDQLEPSIAKEIAEIWRPGISKVQVQMQKVNGRNAKLGAVFPQFRRVPSSVQIRDWLTRTGEYPTPPGSGNAYSREFLEQLFPLDDSCGDAADSACLAAAPYFGDVVTIRKPLVRYRIHEGNRSKLNRPERFTRQIERALQRHQFALAVTGRNSTTAAVVPPLRRGRHLLQMRIAERRLNRTAPPVPDDSRTRQARDVVLSLFAPGIDSRLQRVLIAVWCVLTLVAPLPIARQLIGWRFR